MYKHYLYRHIRLDKNEPFYIGIGTKPKIFNTFSAEYKRAYDCKSRRNKIWRDVITKTNYTVDILLESNDYNFIKQQEIEFIKLYGRKNLGTGTLANLTDGGDGSLGMKFSQERADKISKANTGKVKSIIERLAISKRLQKPVINKESGMIFSSIKAAAGYENITIGSLYQGLWLCSPSCKYKYVDTSLNFIKKVKLGRGRAGVKIINIETNEIFNTCKEVAEFENINLFKFYTGLNYKNKYFKYKRITK